MFNPRRTTALCLLLVNLLLGRAFAEEKPARGLEIHYIDTEGGAATLIVTPEGESILADAGNPGDRDAGRISKAAKDAGLTQIDLVITTHWHLDHVGGLTKLSELIPLKRFYDHGIPEPLTKDIRPEDIAAYRKVTAGKTTALKAGDEIALKSLAEGPPLRLRIVAANGLVQGEDPSAIEHACEKGHAAKPIDGSDNAKSIAFLLSFGDFKFFDGGDLTWNIEHKLVCPRSLVGTADVFQANHHGLDESNNPALIEGLAPRVAIVNCGARKGGEAGTLTNLKKQPGLEAVFQLHRSVRVKPELNAPPEQTANDEEACKDRKSTRLNSSH